MIGKMKVSLLLANLLLPFAAYAASPSHFVVTPSCLVKNINNNSYQVLSTQGDFVLIKTDDTGIDKLIEAKTHEKCGGFIDVTQYWHDFKTKAKNKAPLFLREHLRAKPSHQEFALNYSIRYQNEVNTILKGLDASRMWADLVEFSAFPDRYFKSDNGRKAAVWLQDKVAEIAKGRKDVTIYTVKTGTYKQPSVVVKIEGFKEKDNDPELPAIVIGGHMDTTSGLKPGADDDGSGTVTVLETARVLLNSGYQFKKPIYIIWYAAEEAGLVGSQKVVADFMKKNIQVSEVMQLDMTGYPDKSDPTAIWLMEDYVSKPLTNYLELLINTYVKKPARRKEVCGYPCSDHASWYFQGYNSCIPFESRMSTYNPTIHSSNDTTKNLDRDHMRDYAMLAIAFAVELAEPVSG